MLVKLMGSHETIEWKTFNNVLEKFQRWIWKRHCYWELRRLTEGEESSKRVSKKMAELLTEEETRHLGQWKNPQEVARAEVTYWDRLL